MSDFVTSDGAPDEPVIDFAYNSDEWWPRSYLDLPECEWEKARAKANRVLRAMGTKELRHPASERFHTILRECGELHDKKQRDYGRDDDPFANVRSSEEWGVPAWVGALVRATDKVRRLQTFAQKGELANESVIDSLNDLINYAAIARVLYEQDLHAPDKTEQVGSGDRITHGELAAQDWGMNNDLRKRLLRDTPCEDPTCPCNLDPDGHDCDCGRDPDCNGRCSCGLSY